MRPACNAEVTAHRRWGRTPRRWIQRDAAAYEPAGTSAVIIRDDNDTVGIQNATIAHFSAHDLPVV